MKAPCAVPGHQVLIDKKHRVSLCMSCLLLAPSPGYAWEAITDDEHTAFAMGCATEAKTKERRWQ